MLTKSMLLLAATAAAGTRAQYTYLAGYEPQSDVVPHSTIDLDVRDIAALLPPNEGLAVNDATGTSWDPCPASSSFGPQAGANGSNGSNASSSTNATGGGRARRALCDDIAAAEAIYRSGKNSIKSSGSKRTIRGFSTAVASKISGNAPASDVDFVNEPQMKIANAFWKTHGPGIENSWADAIITAAFAGSTVGPLDFGAKGGDFRKEAIQKGIVYLNVMPYALWEFQDSINDCKTGDRKANGGSVHAWDEGVAFYTGSAEGVAEGGLKGYLQFQLAEKRCTNFGTCTADGDNNPKAGYSALNKEIFTLFTQGEEQVLAKNTTECALVEQTRDKIGVRMLVPMVQGTLRYLYKTNTDESAKEAGELFAFGSAILPAVHACDAAIGELLYDRVWKGDKIHSYAAHKANLESLYPCLGITCTDVGDLTQSASTALPACTDRSPTSAPIGPGPGTNTTAPTAAPTTPGKADGSAATAITASVVTAFAGMLASAL